MPPHLEADFVVSRCMAVNAGGAAVDMLGQCDAGASLRVATLVAQSPSHSGSRLTHHSGRPTTPAKGRTDLRRRGVL